MNIDQNIYQKHCDCEIAVDRNYITKKQRQTIRSTADLAAVLKSNNQPPALICATHGGWLKWLSPLEADEIEAALKEPK
jgi:hypothetical protein